MYTEIETNDSRLPSAKTARQDISGLKLLKAILKREGIVTRHRRGEYLYRAGSRLDRVFLIEDGFAAQTRVCRSGKRQVLDFAVPGSILAGQGSLPEQGAAPRLTHSVEVLSNTTVSMMSASSFRRCLEESPQAKAAWGDLMATALERAYGQLTNIGCRQGLQRMCYILAELDHRLTEAGQRDDAAIPLRQIDLADAAGITTVYVNQNLKKLEADGVLYIHKGSIVILDTDYIAEVSGYRQ